MKENLKRPINLGLAFLLLFLAQGVVLAPSRAELKPTPVLGIMKKVADWQIAHPSKHDPAGWEQGVYYTGVMALYDVSKDQTYLNEMLEMGRKNNWQLGRRHKPYHADDHTVGQTYLKLYEIKKDAQMIAPTRERFDSILLNPKQQPFSRTANNPQDRWSWCDALFMAPAAWAQLAAATGDRHYLDFMDREWWATTKLLYDPEEKLFYRDWRYLDKKSANGKKIFWSRGNGWVYGGLVRVLEYLPKDHPSRPRYLKLYQEMTDAIVATQQADGLWRPSLLDPTAVPDGETSGSGLFVYGLAWGINQGLLDASKYLPAASRGWTAMVGKVHDDGKLGAVQPIGDSPAHLTDDSTEVYGPGTFLLAGSEIYKHLTQKTKAPLVSVESLTPVTVAPPTPVQAPQSVATQPATTDPATTRPATWARFVPERLDDFAWENDLIAFRAYGPAIKTTKGTEDSGIDCWLKRVPYPIIDKWYALDKKGLPYHTDHGEGNDPYHVGATRGCGGLGIWQDGQMITSGPYKTWKIISREPQKTIFELTYDYNVAGAKIEEVKRITIELGQRLFRAESTFTRDGRPAALDIAIGITTHNGKAKPTFDPKHGWMSCWEKLEGYGLGTGVAIAPARVALMREVKSQKPDESHALLLTRTDGAGQVAYYAGYGWEKAGQINTPEKWTAYLNQFAASLK